MPDGIITIIYVIVIIILLAAVIKLMKAREKNLDRKAAKALIGSAADGRIPEKDSISSYYKAKLQSCEEYVDDITMKDLDFDKVFGKIDTCMTSVGEEFLYSQLHFCDADAREKINELCSIMSDDPKTRLDIYTELYDLSIINYNGAADIVCGKSLDEFKERTKYILYPLSTIIFLITAIISSALNILPLSAFSSILFVCAATLNLIKFYSARKKLFTCMGAAKYIAMQIHTAESLSGIEKISAVFPEMREVCKRLSPLKKNIMQMPSFGMGDAFEIIVDIFKACVQSEVHAYCKARRLISERLSDVEYIYKAVGIIDSSCAVLNYRENLSVWCYPDFTEENELHTAGMVHPLIADPVSNDADICNDILLTGANASGKSSFIKALALNAIFAQAIGICTAERFSLKPCRVITSMAVNDNISDGDSYFMAELKSMRRVTEKGKAEPCICFIDEILKGTNTTERIAASESVLEYMHSSPSLCIAATHDIELTEKDNGYDNFHFSENVINGNVCFDYKLKKGAASSKNAILLMSQLGFSRDIVNRANELAE